MPCIVILILSRDIGTPRPPRYGGESLYRRRDGEVLPPQLAALPAPQPAPLRRRNGAPQSDRRVRGAHSFRVGRPRPVHLVGALDGAARPLRRAAAALRDRVAIPPPARRGRSPAGPAGGNALRHRAALARRRSPPARAARRPGEPVPRGGGERRGERLRARRWRGAAASLRAARGGLAARSPARG